MTHVGTPWQHAVYTRRTKRDYFKFSHVSHSTVKKAFPPSLQLPHLLKMNEIRGGNADIMRNTAVLVLVTGKWAQCLSVEAFVEAGCDLEKIPPVPYDHLERLGVDARAGGECGDLTDAYRNMQYHCTMAQYAQGELHDWTLSNVTPILSDIVVLPRLLREDRLKLTMSSLNKALRKSLRDSLILAGGVRYREENWEMKNPIPAPPISPIAESNKDC